MKILVIFLDGVKELGSIFREPSNALSNIGFMILGLLMFWVLGKDIKSNNSNQFTGLNSISILYAGAAIFLGPGSLLMHGTHTEWGEWADNIFGYFQHFNANQS